MFREYGDYISQHIENAKEGKYPKEKYG